jgi:leucyl aminopeptidase
VTWEALVKYSVIGKRGYEVRGDLLVCGVTEEGLSESLNVIDGKVGGLIREVLGSGEMRGKLLETSVLHVSGRAGSGKLLLIGLGNASQIDHEVVRKAGGTASRTAREHSSSRIVVDLETFSHRTLSPDDTALSLAEGAGLSLYRFTKHKSEDENGRKDPAALVFAAAGMKNRSGLSAALENVRIIVESTDIARDLANEPANVLTPVRFSDFARKICRRHGLTCRVLNRERMRKLGMGGILAVSAGSGEPPVLLVVEHRGAGSARKSRTVAIVGKGVTFDSGGISIKPADKMEEMKYDKAGACAVMGIMNAVAQLDLPLNVVGLMPLCENLPGGKAYRPGDVVKMHSGKTVEVISTDAEGRMIMADALSYSMRYAPHAVFDLATLTGACVIALGLSATGIVANDAGLIERLEASAERTGERVWNLPTWKEYREQLKSDIADMKNVGGREAGAITAGLFLKEFVGDTPWAHLDIAGTAWVKKDMPYLPRGATGVGVRLLVDFLSHWGGTEPSKV